MARFSKLSANHATSPTCRRIPRPSAPGTAGDQAAFGSSNLSDQFAPFHTKVIAATANEAPHVLDGLIYHQSSLVINEHYTDTGGFSDHVFAMCRLLGFLFAPRIRDLKDKRLYILPGMNVPPELAPLVAGAINVRAITAQWNELLRLATSYAAAA
jgi:TnpA family transposase